MHSPRSPLCYTSTRPIPSLRSSWPDPHLGAYRVVPARFESHTHSILSAECHYIRQYEYSMWLQIIIFVVCLAPLLASLPQCYQAILNDARIIAKDPALRGSYEILYAYPGFWALFWYRLSHALLQREVPFISAVVPRLAMSIVRYATAIDIHPGAEISSDGILIDHGTALVVGETAVVGAGVTLYHGVTLGNSGKKLPPGAKRHPTIGDRVVIGAGAKILGDIVIGDDVLVGANSIVTKPVPKNHTAVGIPARVLCHGSVSGKDVTGAAICELHRRLQKVEKGAKNSGDSANQSRINSNSSTVDNGSGAAIRREKQAGASVEEGQSATIVKGRETSFLGSQTMVQTVPIMLPSPREKQAVPAYTRPIEVVVSDEHRSDKIPARFVLERAEFSPRHLSDSSSTSSEGTRESRVDAKRSAIGDVLYSLRVLGE